MLSTPPIDTSHAFSNLSSLKNAARNQSPEALKETAQLFEAQFIQMLFKTMRASSVGDEVFGSEQTKFYQEMYDKEIANTLAKTGQLGFADMIVKQLSTQMNEQPDKTVSIESTGLGLTTVKATDVEKTKTVAEKIESYVDKVWSAAKNAADKLNIKPEILIAQSALETGWGQHIGQHAAGKFNHNYFGIKADDSWKAQSSAQKTQEFNGRFLQTVNDDFRAYDSTEKSFDDYAEFILTNKRYAELPGSEPENYVQKLQQQGYATDPQYADKITSIMNNPHFQEKIAALQPQDLLNQDDNTIRVSP